MLTKENINGLEALLDKAIEPKNILLEKLSDWGIKGGIKVADGYLEKFIPEEFHQDINETVAEILTKDYGEALMELWDLIGLILEKYVKPLLVPKQTD